MSQLRITESDIRLILHGTRQVLVYTSDVHTRGGNIHATNKNTEALVVVCKEIFLDVHAEKTKSCDLVSELTRRKDKIKMRNKSHERWRRVQIFGNDANGSKPHSRRH